MRNFASGFWVQVTVRDNFGTEEIPVLNNPTLKCLQRRISLKMIDGVYCKFKVKIGVSAKIIKS